MEGFGFGTTQGLATRVDTRRRPIGSTLTHSMPTKAKTIRQRRPLPDRGRKHAAARGYDRAWTKLRDYHLRNVEPLCRICNQQGRTTAAEVVDHIVPIVIDATRRLDPTNLRSLCVPHHAQVTARFRDEGINEVKDTQK